MNQRERFYLGHEERFALKQGIFMHFNIFTTTQPPTTKFFLEFNESELFLSTST
jgi:hypothetical protein